MTVILFSILIPTFNRKAKIGVSVDSALAWLEAAGDGEIVIVDDASTDGTVDYLYRHYGDQIQNGKIQIIVLAQNQGVTGARNAGALAAQGQWMVMLDSDDMLIADAAQSVLDRIAAEHEAPIIFFRCRDMGSGRLIGVQAESDVRVDARAMLRDWQWAECLPVIRRAPFLAEPYEARLRGYEALAYYRMARRFAPAVVSTIHARLYDGAGEDRLSTRRAINKRACMMGLGHMIVVREFWREMGVVGCVKRLVKAAAYGCMCIIRRW